MPVPVDHVCHALDVVLERLLEGLDLERKVRVRGETRQQPDKVSNRTFQKPGVLNNLI